ncbi:MAG: Rpn family recombination-promoting nuclease/putative transposase [Lachnospiraceae bacterium]
MYRNDSFPCFKKGGIRLCKKIRLKDTSLFLIVIIEHQSSVHYDTAFRLLRYMVMVLTDYGAEQEQKQPGITSRKEFQYPPILPLVFYDGPGNWTAVSAILRNGYS